MPFKCAALGCTTGYVPAQEKVSVFKVPKSEDLLKKWQKAIPWKCSVLKSTHRVCENHFQEEEIKRKILHRDKEGNLVAEGNYKIPKLKEHAIPSKCSDDVNKGDTIGNNDMPQPNKLIIKSECKEENELELVDLPIIKSEQDVRNMTSANDAQINTNHVTIKVEHDDEAPTPATLFETLVKDPAAIALPPYWARLVPADGGRLVIYTQYISKKVDSGLKALHWKEVVVNEKLVIQATVMGRPVKLTKFGIAEGPIQGLTDLENTIRKVDTVNICIGGTSPDEFPRATGKRSYGKWSQRELQIALAAYRNGECGLNECSRLYKIPKATLKRHLERKNIHANDEHKVMGRPTVFTKEIEDELVQHLLKFEEKQFGLTITDVRRLAFEVAERSSILHSFNKEKRIAGKKWYYSFMARHPELSLRQTECSVMSKVAGLNRQKLTDFFELLEEYVDKNRIDATTIFIVDELTFSAVQRKPDKVLFVKGSQHSGSIEKSADVSVMLCANATGTYIPPMIIFKHDRITREFEDRAPVGSLVEISTTGCIHSELFVAWLKHFHNKVQSTKQKPALLLLDSHTIHSKTVEALEFARDNGIILLQLPGHATQRFRPLDVTLLNPLKTHFNEAQEKWLQNNNERTMTIFEVSPLLAEAYSKTATAGNAEGAFRVSGIWPVNGDNIQNYQELLRIGEVHNGNAKNYDSFPSTSHFLGVQSIAGTSHHVYDQLMARITNESVKRSSSLVFNNELKKVREEKNTQNEDEDEYDWLMHL